MSLPNWNQFRKATISPQIKPSSVCSVARWPLLGSLSFYGDWLARWCASLIKGLDVKLPELHEWLMFEPLATGQPKSFRNLMAVSSIRLFSLTVLFLVNSIDSLVLLLTYFSHTQAPTHCTLVWILDTSHRRPVGTRHYLLEALKAVEPHQALASFDFLFRQATEARTLTNKHFHWSWVARSDMQDCLPQRDWEERPARRLVVSDSSLDTANRQGDRWRGTSTCSTESSGLLYTLVWLR